MIVVDANVILFLLLNNPHFTPLVRNVYDIANVWCAPALWRSEFRSTLMQYVRSTDKTIPGASITLSDAVEYMGDAEEIIAETGEVDTMDVLSLADQSGCSTYDCEYVSLAKKLDVKLLTFDETLTNAFPDTAIHPENMQGNE